MSYYLGLDVGASNLRCALATADYDHVAQIDRQTPQGPTVEAFTDGIRAAITDTLAEAGVAPAAVDGAGIASIGPLDVTAGLIRETVNLDSSLEAVPIRATVASCLPEVPVWLCNDAIAGVVAEYCERDPVENLAYLTLSSGIGAGVVVDGHVLHGVDGNAAEVGHVTLDPGASRPCGCGGRGHWEAFAGGENIPAYAADIAETEGLDDSLLADGCTTATVFEAHGEDPLATETVERVGDWNAQGVATLVNAFAPRSVAVGGAVALNNERLVLDRIRERIGRYLMGPAPEIRLTRLGTDVVLRGALLLAAGEGPSATVSEAGAGGKQTGF
jgi:glucokinase